MASKKTKKAVRRKSRVAKKFNAPSLTEQYHRDEIDTSVLVRRWMNTGIPPTHQRRDGWYGIVPAIDFHTAKNTVMRAEQSFNELPARIRAQFNNDPQSFLAFAGDEENQEELLEILGPPPENLDEEYEDPQEETGSQGEPEEDSEEAEAQ